MFDRYTEHARRVIFFARYEASNLGSEWIETEHLLLGIMREDQLLRSRLPRGAMEQIRNTVAQRTQRREKVATSVDIPLSSESKHALAYGDEESTALGHKVIDCGHLLLGMLRIENCLAAVLLREYGIEHASYRDIVDAPQSGYRPAREPAYAVEQSEPETEKAAAPSLQDAIDALTQLSEGTADRLHMHSDVFGQQRLKRKPWSRKEALGHLIDWASAHHQWLARALTEPRLTARSYPPDDWVSAQQYGSFPWDDLVDLWIGMNQLLVHVLHRIPADKADTECRIGIDEPIPLTELIARYVKHCEDILGQILARL